MDEQILNYISRSFSGEATEKEINYIKHWCQESASNQQTFNNLKAAWNADLDIANGEIPNSNLIWAKIESGINSKSSHTIKNNNWLYWGAAAAILIALTLTWVFSSSLFNNTIHYNTAIAEKKTVTLPDGSNIKLNVDTQLSYTGLETDSVRTVYMRGQAFFDIKKDGRPFIINTQHAKIVVLGTEFDVLTRNEKTKVAVKSGLVRVMSRKTDIVGAVLLSKNQTSTIFMNKAPQKAQNIPAAKVIGWINGLFIFENTPLSEIIEELYINYGVKVKLQTASMGRLQLTGEFKDQSPEEIISLLCLALDLKYSTQNNTFIIHR